MPAVLRVGPYRFFFYSGDGDGPPMRSKSSGTSTFPTMKPSRAGAEGKALPPRLPDELSFVLIGNDQLDPGHWDVLAISRLCGALAHSRASSEVSLAITDRQDGCHASFQRGYRAGRLSPSRACPGVLQFLLMQRGPLQNHALGAWRKTPMQDRWRIDTNHGTVAAVSRVEVCRRVVVKIHLDDNAVEPADFRQRPEPPAPAA